METALTGQCHSNCTDELHRRLGHSTRTLARHSWAVFFFLSKFEMHMFVLQWLRKVEAFSLDLIILRVRPDALSLFLSFIGLSLRVTLFVPRRSFFHSFSLLADLSQLTEAMIVNPSLSLYHSRLASNSIFFFANQHEFKKKFTIVKRVHVWVEWYKLRSSWEVRGTREGAKRQCYVAVNIGSFPCLFPRADIEHHDVLPESLSYHSKLKWLLFQSKSCCYASSTKSNFYPSGSLFISGLSDREARKLSRASGAKRSSSARSAKARATPGWTASWLYFDTTWSLKNYTCSRIVHWHDLFTLRGIKMESIKMAIQLHWFPWSLRYVKLVYFKVCSLSDSRAHQCHRKWNLYLYAWSLSLRLLMGDDQ